MKQFLKDQGVICLPTVKWLQVFLILVVLFAHSKKDPKYYFVILKVKVNSYFLHTLKWFHV